MLSKKYYINSNDVDQFYDLKISSFFKMMQEVASQNAEELGIGHVQTNSKNLIWVITRFLVKIHKLPKYQEIVTLKTYPGKTIKFIFPRYFVLEDENGNKLIEASSTWLVLYNETRKVCISPFDKDIEGEDQVDQLPLADKVEHVEDLSFVEERKVRYNDIDLNGHLNNTKYIEYILDIHDSNFYKEHEIKEILINYNHELKNNDLVSIYSNKQNPEIIKGNIGETNSFDVKVTYIKK